MGVRLLRRPLGVFPGPSQGGPAPSEARGITGHSEGTASPLGSQTAVRGTVAQRPSLLALYSLLSNGPAGRAGPGLPVPWGEKPLKGWHRSQSNDFVCLSPSPTAAGRQGGGWEPLLCGG